MKRILSDQLSCISCPSCSNPVSLEGNCPHLLNASQVQILHQCYQYHYGEHPLDAKSKFCSGFREEVADLAVAPAVPLAELFFDRFSYIGLYAGDPAAGGLLQGHPYPAFALGHGGEHVSRGGQLLPRQIFGKDPEHPVPVIRQGLEHGGQGRIAGAGDGGIGKGDLPPEEGLQEALPACDPVPPDQLGIVDEDQGQGREGGPQVGIALVLGRICRAAALS